jgi:hypothetical protein
MAIFFINAPAQIIHRVLPLINEKKFENLIIVTTGDLVQFFKENINAKILVTNLHPNLITKNIRYKLISNAIKANLEYRRFFKDIKDEEIYLFFTSWSVVYLSYVAKLSKKNRVYLYPEKDAHSLYGEEKSLRASFMKLFAKLLLGVEVYIINKSGVPVWELRRDSFPMEIVEYDKFNSKISDKFMQGNKLLNKKEILFVGDEIVLEGADEKSVIELNNKIMDLLDNNFCNKYSIKPHPRDEKLYGKMSESKNIIPPHILAETLMNHKWKYIIGYYSEVLLSAKIRTNANVISLLHLWKWNNLELKKYWQSRFEKDGIFLPENIEELKNLLEPNDMKK